MEHHEEHNYFHFLNQLIKYFMADKQSLLDTIAAERQQVADALAAKDTIIADRDTTIAQQAQTISDLQAAQTGTISAADADEIQTGITQILP